MAEQTFMKITNRDIYEKLNDLVKKHDVVVSTVRLNEEKISNVQKVAWGTAGALATIATSIIIFLITAGF